MPHRPMRVLQVARRYLPELGGMETHTAEISRRLAERGDMEVTVLATDRSGRLPRSERMAGYDVIRRRSWPAERDYYFSPGIAPVIARGPWDIVHFQGINTLVPVIGMMAALAGRTPFIVSMHSGGHSSDVRNAGRGLQWQLLAPLMRRSARLIAVGRFERDYFARATGIAADHFSIIPNGGGLPAAPGDVQMVPGRIISSGRLEKYKGHHRVIEALPLIRQRRPDAHLVILGSGPYEPELRALASRLQVADAVQWRSLAPEDRMGMARELTAASVMAALSDYEAHPIGIMEALTLGRPVVGLNQTGIGDLVEDGFVTGVPEGATADQIAVALVQALEDHEAGPAARPGPVELPTWESSAELVAGIYHRALADGPALACRN